MKEAQNPIIACRKQIATKSIEKAKNRIAIQKQFHRKYDGLQIQQLYDDFIITNAQYQLLSTQYADTSIVTKGKFDSRGQLFVTVGASSEGKVWLVDQQSINNTDFQCITQLKGATSKLNDVAIHPNIGKIPGYAPNFLTGSLDGSLQVWTFAQDLKQQKCINIQAHEDRLNCLQYIDDGNFFVSAGYDKNWILWDSFKLRKIFTQKGHQRQIHTQSVHPDCSIIFTGDLSGSGMFWDLRIGKGIYEVSDTNSILCSAFKPNGYQFAFAGKTNLITIVDLRKRSKAITIPAHVKLISDLKYDKTGMMLFSCSHDNYIKMWHGLNYGSIGEKYEQISKITSLDLTDELLGLTLMDRKWSLWKKKLSNFKIQKQEQIIQN